MFRLLAGSCLLVSASYLLGQATPVFQQPGMQAPGGNQGYSTQSPAPFNPLSPTPHPGRSPFPYETEQYLNSIPSFRALDQVTRINFINQATSGNMGQYLSNGMQNPYYQSGTVKPTPNWYLPSTWASPRMNWQGVQSNGFLPNGSATTYDPNAGHTLYNPGTVYRPPTTYRTTTNTNSSASGPTRALSGNDFQPPTGIGATGFRPANPSLSVAPRSIGEIQRALALHESGGDKVAEAIDHSELARLFLQKDKPDLALNQVSDAERVPSAANNQQLQLDLTRIKAAAFMSSGEFEQGIASYREVMRLLRVQRDEPDQAEIYISVGWAFQSLGKMQDAMACYQSALIVFRNYKDTEGEARTLIAMGSLYGSMGKFDMAVEQFSIAARAASPDEFVQILVSAGQMFESRGMPENAVNCYEKAASFIQKKKGDPMLLGAVEAGLGRNHMALGEFEQAQSDFRHAESQMKASGDRTGEAGVIASIAELHFQIATLPDALNGYKKALALMREENDRIGEIGVLTGMGSVYEAEGKVRQAIDYYGQALAKLEDLRTSARLDEFRTDLASQSENLYGRVIELQLRQHNMEEAFNLSERARARTLLDLLGNARVASTSQLPESFAAREDTLRKENILLQRQLGQELARPLPEVNEERMRSIQAQLSAVRQEYQHSIDELKIASPSYAYLLSVAPLTLHEAQQQLNTDTTVLSYFTLPDKTLAFVITRDSFQVTELRVKEKALGSSVSTLLDFASESEAPPEFRSLYASLIAPLKSQLKTRTLAIVPYGILHDLPFAALTSDGNHFLGDEYSIAMLPSVSAWPYLRARPGSRGGNGLVLAGDSVEGHPDLDLGHDEAEAVASLLGSKPLFGHEASVATLRAHGGEFGILHLMGHVDHDTSNPEFSRFVLGDEGNEEGNLDIHEILSLDLRKTNLIVLSGCQSQKGNQTRGDDLTALSRAFMYAGAPSVIASLWDVDDEATKQLMVAFYTHLRDGMSKAEALQAAQRDVRARFPHPYYWASFVLVGDPGTSGGANLMANSKP